MFLHFYFELDPNDLPVFCLADVLVLDLHGIHSLDEVRVLPLDMDNVSHSKLPTSELNDAHAKVRIIVGDPADKIFIHLGGHRRSPFEFCLQLLHLGLKIPVFLLELP